MTDISTPTIKDENLHYEPFFHIEIPQIFDLETSKQLHKKFLDNMDWEPELETGLANVEGVKEGKEKVANVWWARDYNFPEFDNFYSMSWISKLFTTFKLPVPDKFYQLRSLARHRAGTERPPHTDGPPDSSAFRNARKRWNTEINGCIVQHIYILDTTQYPDTGMFLRYANDERTPVKQIKSLPGNYIAYRNTPNSYHSVPEQTQQFDRMLLNLKTFW